MLTDTTLIFNMFNICSEEVVRYGNVFGLSRYIRYCGKFNIYNIIFVDNGLGNCSKGFGYRTVFSIYLVRFKDYIVDLLKQFTNTYQFTHGFIHLDILRLRGT